MRNARDKVLSSLGPRPPLQTGQHTGRRTLMEEPTAAGRKHKRVSMAVPASYDRRSLIDGKELRLHHGMVRDFSDSGICLFTSAPLNRGERIAVLCRDIWSAEKSGTVLWCHTLDFRLFRVGVDLQ
jgi:hypothetical protein